MYGIFTYIWLVIMENVGRYTIHGWYGLHFTDFFQGPNGFRVRYHMYHFCFFLDNFAFFEKMTRMFL